MSVQSQQQTNTASHSSTNQSNHQNRSQECTFFVRTGLCSYGSKCIHLHKLPESSHFVLLPQAYIPPLDPNVDESAWFEDYIEDMLDEAEKIGPVMDIVVLENTLAHLIGNTYIQFVNRSDAQQCVEAWTGRWYRGQKLDPQLNGLVEFSHARCGQSDQDGGCKRGPTCNFFHIRTLPRWLLMRIYDTPEYLDRMKTEILNGFYADCPGLYGPQFQRFGIRVPTAPGYEEFNKPLNDEKRAGRRERGGDDEPFDEDPHVVRRGRGFGSKS